MNFAPIIRGGLCCLMVLAMLGCREAKAPAQPTQFRAYPAEVTPPVTHTLSLQPTPDGMQPYWVDQLSQHEGALYLTDAFKSRRVYVYGQNGDFHQQIGGLGSGPGEYQIPEGFARADRTMLVTNTMARQAILYDHEGAFLKNVPLPFKGIADKVYVTPQQTYLLTSYSRYSPEATIYEVDQTGRLIRSFSPLDEVFGTVFDTYRPPGSLCLQPDRIMQVFNHRYEIKVFAYNGELLETIRLASGAYTAPDEERAARVSGHQGELAFHTTFSHVAGIHAVSNGYVTALFQRASNLRDQKGWLEFWDHQWVGRSRFTIPENEYFITVLDEALVFLREDAQEMRLVFRSLPAPPQS